MTHYRLYSVDGLGKIEAAEWIEASADEDAIMIARARRQLLDCELWDHGRLVARLPKEGPMAFFVPPSSEANSLTPFEHEIVGLIAQGHSAKEIARRVTLAPRTVERHIDICRQKIGA
ncbi:MAG: response regulator transcription factor, partial [Sphingomicrobium sp.]